MWNVQAATRSYSVRRTYTSSSQDGYDDLLLNFVDGRTFIVTTGNVNNLNSGASPPFNYGPVSTLDTLAGITTGDFNGDERPEIVGLVQLPSGGIALVIYTVDPKTLAVSKAAQITLQKPGTGSFEVVSIASGKCSVSDHDQLVVAYMPSGVAATTLELIDVNENEYAVAAFDQKLAAVRLLETAVVQ